jgi:hypothetical protein
MFYIYQTSLGQEISEDLKKLGYKVSQNPSTNQIIIHAADNDEAIRLRSICPEPTCRRFRYMWTASPRTVWRRNKDWETTILIENLFGEEIPLGKTNIPAPLSRASLREAQRSTFGMDFGFWKNEGIPGHQYERSLISWNLEGTSKFLLIRRLKPSTQGRNRANS